MQLTNTDIKNKYNIYFNEKETENIRMLLNSPMDYKNARLCYYIEKIIPLNFNQLSNKRIMIMEIYTGYNYMVATIKAQNIPINFKRPLDRVLTVAQVYFSDARAFKRWKQKEGRLYTIESVNSKGILVTVFDLTLEDEISLALNEDVRVVSTYNIIEYFFNKTINVFRECFQN